MTTHSAVTRSRIPRFVLLLALIATLSSMGVRSRGHGQQNKAEITAEQPRNYFAGNFSKHAGKMFLDTGRPAGVFVGYPAEGQNIYSFMEDLKQMVAKMLLHNVPEVLWTSASLPPHKGFESELGTLNSAVTDKSDVQLAFYSRPDGFAYGYFAMRNNAGAPLDRRCPDGKFLDSLGGGVPAFDEFMKSIRIEVKQ